MSYRGDRRAPADASTFKPKKKQLRKEALKESPREQKREGALRQALANAFGEDGKRAARRESNEIDVYGKGAPTDRLQFGYSPSVLDEALEYHAQYAAADWVDARRRHYKTAILQQEPLVPLNCEPFASVLKLKKHWEGLSQFNADVGAGQVDMDHVDSVLDLLAAKQRTAM
ncbi:hypothetical protein STCU_07549 [Strigomonas culicis]|uniref:Uncharacterized protein n=1 Tax=Strigomonas culicis TaxID=28005 RepID=S9V9P5_9TRYP|nr:hypothetical protein STCU_07549 [Strigomonas culicis]|eukprot:EPY23691.1 hypothetical protein STCU_07549 [Strigomonas culicis]